jgi:DNA-binding transcriptional MerR regulator
LPRGALATSNYGGQGPAFITGGQVSPPGGIHHKLNDQDFPAYTMGLAAELLGVQPAFLRSLDAAGLLSPGRSAGGQRRYSRAELTLALQVRELLNQNMPLAAAIRIVSLEHQLAAAHQRITHLEQTIHRSPTPANPQPETPSTNTR